MSRDGNFACWINPAAQSAIGKQQWPKTGLSTVLSRDVQWSMASNVISKIQKEALHAKYCGYFWFSCWSGLIKISVSKYPYILHRSLRFFYASVYADIKCIEDQLFYIRFIPTPELSSYYSDCTYHHHKLAILLLIIFIYTFFTY